MWARVVHMPGASTHDFVDTVRAATARQLPITLASPGNRGAIALVDPASGTLLTITLWETPEALEASAGQLRPVVSSLEESTGAPRGAGKITPWKLVVCDAPSSFGIGSDPSAGARDDGPFPFARVTVYPGDAGPDLVRRARDAAVAVRPLFAELRGYLGGFAVADPATGRVLTGSLWDSAESLTAAAERLRGGSAAFSIAVAPEGTEARPALWDVLACDLRVRIISDEDDPDP